MKQFLLNLIRYICYGFVVGCIAVFLCSLVLLVWQQIKLHFVISTLVSMMKYSALAIAVALLAESFSEDT